MFENIALAFQGIWSHKMRSFLTMLGIIIGVASIIMIVSTIKGTNEQIKENLIGSGTNAVVVQLYQNDYNYDMQYSPLPEGVALITEDTRKEIDDISGVEETSLYRQRSYVYNTVFYLNNSFTGGIIGADGHYFDVFGYEVAYGRALTAEDLTNKAKVAVLDIDAAKSMFTGQNPVGKTIEIAGEPFSVIGVVARSSDFQPVINSLSDYYMYMGETSGNVFVPIDTWPVIYRYDEPQSVGVKATSTDDMTTVGRKVADLLTERQILNTQSTLSYKSQDLMEYAQQLQSMANSTNQQLIWIASISLLVGGIGVMNIMLVSVTERTREIGLKKAIGAKRKRILRQFLTEAAALTSLGGVIGVVAGIGFAELLSGIMGTPVAISVPSIFIAVIFSMLIGVVFGLLPAVKASKLNPIEALRRE